MTKTVDFIFDFGSPNAYLSYKVLPAILERTGAKMKLIPSLLGGIFKATNNQSPMMAFGGVKGKLEYENLETRRFIKKHGLTAFKMNPHFPVNTLTLMRGAIYAEREGFLDAYVEAGLKAMWEDGQKMDDPEVFVSVMTDAGLDGAAILAATQEPDVKAGLIANTEAAVSRGAFGIPTFFVGDEMYFGKNTLGEVEAALSE
ncbi:2-hydroxychromene-2-carboxylate isomerase [Ponticaulis sp.]|uniref:2-hydroxychromene-2-carboxylate isomerase n=1 Tax=Ponticaulis sp. TaxID=2020902 RepID=UPI000C4B18C4|nr:2-hydroxychromene-2-carboxylate isomerase [Ponticaulis sp.]MAJ10469.1 disulfide bond formation protein DsbA [Ponticaulis sp.]HBJ94195.1 disulfide bond formation protein DsbA [Hyphomonadaceae bacterium]|tara:strand:+ start:2142 stop:2744 length:603 start_codon:yes stop_codon:yes gene_type:complete